MKNYCKRFFKMFLSYRSIVKRYILALLTTCYSLLTFSQAGITDFKTIEKAQKAYESKKYMKSASLWGGIETKSPQKDYDIGNAYYKAKKYDAAIKSYEKAEGIDENRRLHNIGNSYFQKNNFDEAISNYEKALQVKEDKDTRFNLELAKKQKKKKEQKKKQDKPNQKEQKKNKKEKQDKEQKKNKNKKDDKKQNKKDQKKKNKQDKQKKDKKKKDGKKDKSKSNKEQKTKDKKGEKDSDQAKQQKQMSKEEKLKAQELKRLLKKMRKGKTPTMIYQMGEGKKEERKGDINPW